MKPVDTLIRTTARRLALTAMIALTPFAQASSTPSAIGQLGQSLTPIGAERAGNTAGTIPAWAGGLKPEQGAMESNGHMADPFANDEVLFTITAQNLEPYRQQLTPGQLAMFKRYPETFRMKVYPTRRSASYPDNVYEASRKNAETTALLDGGNGINGLANGVAFPIPENGLEVIWNHMLRYRGDSMDLTLSQVIAEANGDYREITKRTIWNFFPSITDLEEGSNLLFLYKSKVLEPVRMAGEVTLVHEPIDQVEEPRRAWKYLPGQRRVRRAPNVAYDNPATSSDNLKTSDNLDMFNGAPDKYEWTLKGKQEVFIPYNSYALYDKSRSNADIIRPGHINPELARYELHRVWVCLLYTSNPNGRNYYLTQALELEGHTIDPEVMTSEKLALIKTFPIGNFIQAMTVALNPEKSAGINKTLSFDFTDADEQYSLHVRSGIAEFIHGEVADADIRVSVTADDWIELVLGEKSFAAALASGSLSVEGGITELPGLVSFLSLFESAQ